MNPLQTFAIYAGAALAGIAGCFAFWSWLRLGGSAWLIAPGLICLDVTPVFHPAEARVRG